MVVVVGYVGTVVEDVVNCLHVKTLLYLGVGAVDDVDDHDGDEEGGEGEQLSSKPHLWRFESPATFCMLGWLFIFAL